MPARAGPPRGRFEDAGAEEAGPRSPRRTPLDPRAERLGLTFAGLCILNGSVVPAVAKLTTRGAAPLFVAVVTTLFAGGAAFVFLAVRGGLRALVDRRSGPRLAAIGFLGTACASALFFAGAGRSSALDTVLCLQVEPIYALLVAWLFLGHRLTVRRVGAVVVIGAGIALALSGGRASDPLGIVLLLGAPACWQASHLITLRGLRGVAPMVLTGARYLHGGVFLTAWWLLAGAGTGLAPGDPLGDRLPLLALQGVMLSFVGTAFWYQAIARLDLARATAIVVPSIPVVSILATFLLIGSVPGPRQWAGIALTAAGVLAFVTAPHAVERRARIPAPTAPIAAPADPSEGTDAA